MRVSKQLTSHLRCISTSTDMCHLHGTLNIHASTVGLYTIKRMSKGALIPQGFEPNGSAMERSASIPPHPFWSQRVQRDHELEEARPEDLPIQDDDGSSDRGRDQTPKFSVGLSI